MVKVLWKGCSERTQPVHRGGGENEVEGVGREVGLIEASSACIKEDLPFFSAIQRTTRVVSI